jgi:uncharacterized protein (DUF342 family)
MSDQALPLHYYIHISVSDNKLSAYLRFLNIDEKIRLTIEQLEEFAATQRIVHGLKSNVLKMVADNPKAFFSQELLIAEGTAPVEGENGYIKTLFDLDNSEIKPLELEDGKVDFKEVKTIHNIRKGQLIAQRVLATEGLQGRAVTGEVLFPKAGKDVKFKIGKNVVMDQDQLNLYAAIDGMVTKTERDKLNVFPIFEVTGDVDFNIGNIDFVGNVVIRGNVLSGFKIKAAGDIRVSGGIEGAELEAAGSIEISAGILGHNKGTVRAGKNVKCSFIQDATVEAGEAVIVSQSIMHSNIRAGKTVTCKGTKGLIVGGIVQAGDRVVVRTVGNSMSTNTTIEVGVLPELRNEMIALRGQLRGISESLEKSDKALALLDQLAAAGQLGADKVALRIKLNHTKKQALEDQAVARERILEIEKSLEDSDKACVEVVSIIYGGSKIVIGRYTKFVKDPVQRIIFKLEDGDIVMAPM